MVITTESALLTSNRDHLAICVESKVPEVTNEVLKTAIVAALVKVMIHPDFVDAGLASGTAQVDIGCPSPARATQPGFDWETGGSDEQGAPFVDTPSQYRTFAFVVSPSQITGPSGQILHGTAQELYISGGVGAEVTSAVYLTADDVPNIEAVGKYLEAGVGLVPQP